MSEEWKPVVGFEGYYEVSDMGRVRSLDRVVSGKDGCTLSIKGQMMRPRPNTTGYPFVRLRMRGKRGGYTVHRLVAKAFIPNPDNLAEINHKNEDKTDNRVANLEWCDHSYNMRFGTRGERCRKKADCHAVVQMDMEGNVIAEFEAIKLAARVVGINNAETITKCCKGTRPSAGGYKWKYKTVK